MPPQILVSGYYGFGNTGDEAILEALTGELRRQCPDVVLRVLTNDPDSARAQGLEPVPRKSLGAILAALLKSDLLLSGGGGLVQDSTGAGSVAYYLGLVALARLLGRPAMLYCQGWGPVATAKGQWLANRLAPFATKATFRDEQSLQDFRRLAPRVPATLAADPALLLDPPEPKRMAEILKEEGLMNQVGRMEGPTGRIPGSGPLIAVCPRPWPGDHEEHVAAALHAFAEAEKARYVFVPLQPDRDTEPCQRLARRTNGTVVQPRTPREIVGLLGCMDLVVAMRLHALIFAAARGIPMLGLSYDPKVERFCERAGGMHLPLAQAAKLGETLPHFLNGRAHIRRLLAERVEPMREAAREATAEALRLAEGRSSN